MKRKMLIFFVVLLFAVGIACAGNNTTEDLEVEDSGNYILPVSITGHGIEFDDGYTGFCIDLSKDGVTTSDKFTLGALSSAELENNVKLAIIECYKQGKEDAIGDILSQIDDKGSSNEVLKAVFSSQEQIGDRATLNINNETEATFNFEFLDSADESTSDCVAYTVSLKTIEKPDTLTANNDTSDDGLNKTDESEPAKSDNDANDNSKKTLANNENAQNKDKVAATGTKTPEKTTKDNKTATKQNNTTKKTTKDNKTATKQNNTPEKKTSGDNATVNETNKTIVNKTKTVIVNENNTTIINKNNVKTINKTTADTPKNDTVSHILKTVGNPIFLLIIVIAVVAVVVYMRRKD